MKTLCDLCSKDVISEAASERLAMSLRHKISELKKHILRLKKHIWRLENE